MPSASSRERHRTVPNPQAMFFQRMPPHDGEQGQQPDTIERTPGSPQMLHDVLKADGPVQRAHEHKGMPFPHSRGKGLVAALRGVAAPVAHEQHRLAGGASGRKLGGQGARGAIDRRPPELPSAQGAPTTSDANVPSARSSSASDTMSPDSMAGNDMHRLNRHMGKFFKSHLLQCLVNGIRFFPFAGQPFPHEHGRKGPTHRHIRKSLADLRIETPERRLPLRTARTKRCKKDPFFIVIAYKKLYPPFSPYMTSG